MTTVAILTLAIGIAATTAIFSVVYGAFFAPLPYRQPERVVAIWLRDDGVRRPAAPKDFLRWKQQATLFQDMQTWTWRQVNISSGPQPERIQIGPATPGFFSLLGYGEPMLLGRTFTDADGVPGRDRVTILSHRVWAERFAADRQIVGKSIRLDGQPYTVVGVMAPGQSDRNLNRLWVPLALGPEQQEWLLVVGRLKPGVTLDQATAELSTIDRHGDDDQRPANPRRAVTVERFKQSFMADETVSALWILLAGVAFLLVIACVNVANLLLARATQRRGELAIRAALGGSSRAIARQMLTESLVLALGGGLLGVGTAWVLMRTIEAWLPPNLLPTEVEITLNLQVLAFSIAATIASAMVCGILPAWEATRSDLVEILKQNTRSTGRTLRMRRTLVAFECALAVTLLAAGATVIRNVFDLNRASLGFRSEGVLTFGLPMTPGRFASAEQVEMFYTQLLTRLRALPQVSSVAAAASLPARNMGLGASFRVVGATALEPTSALLNMVTPGYFETLGIRVVQGRGFEAQDRRTGAPVAIVNETFVRQFLHGDPLTQSLDVDLPAGGLVQAATVRYRIVGVTADTRNFGPKERPVEEILVPFAQDPWPQATIAMRTTGSPTALTAAATAIVRAMDREVPIEAPGTIAQVVRASLAAEHFDAGLFGGFGAVGLILAALGIYGVMSFTVAQQTRDIGIRIAIGATPIRVLRSVMRDGMVTAIIGTAVGIGGAIATRTLLASVVVDTHTSQWFIVAAVAAVLLTAAFVGCLLPATRAACIDPILAIRRD